MQYTIIDTNSIFNMKYQDVLLQITQKVVLLSTKLFVKKVTLSSTFLIMLL